MWILKCKPINSFSKSCSFAFSECINSTAKLDNLSSSIVVLKCVFHQLKTAEGSFRCQRRYWHSASNLQKSTYLVEGNFPFRNKITEIKERRSILVKYWHIIVSCVALDHTFRLFQL